jgi:hypothetical protein
MVRSKREPRRTSPRWESWEARRSRLRTAWLRVIVNDDTPFRNIRQAFYLEMFWAKTRPWTPQRASAHAAYRAFRPIRMVRSCSTKHAAPTSLHENKPRGSPQNRPYGITSKPANEKSSQDTHLYPVRPIAGNGFPQPDGIEHILISTRAEDRATQGWDPSVDPEAGTAGRSLRSPTRPPAILAQLR